MSLASGRDKDSNARLPRLLVWAVLVLCVLPFLLLQAGVDFSSQEPSFPTGESTRDPGSFFHALSEWTSTCLALSTALLAFLYIYQRPDSLVLLIGITTLLTGLLEAAHTFASHEFREAVFGNQDVISLTWSSSRLARAFFLSAGSVLLLWKQPLTRRLGIGLLLWKQPLTRRLGIGALFTLGLIFVAVFYFIAYSLAGGGLGLGDYSWEWIKRPWDVLPLIVFLVCGFLLFPRLRRSHPGLFSHALLLGVLPDVVSQAHMAFGSSRLYDSYFNIAHFLEVVALSIPLIALALHFVQADRRELTATERLEKAMGGLKREAQARKQVEKKLRSKEVRLSQLAENIREVFWVAVPGAREWVYVSPSYEAVFGQSCESLYRDPLSLLEAVHPDDRERIASMMQQVLKEDLIFEFRIVRPDGRTRWIKVRAFPIRNEKGDVYRVAGISEDVTEQKEAEEALRRAEARNQAILSGIPDLIFRLNRDLVYLDYHAKNDTDLQLPPSRFLGRKLHETLPEAIAQKAGHAFQEVLQTGTVQTIEYRLEMRGKPRDYEARLVKSGDEEVLIMVRDITDQKHLERQILEISSREQQRIGHDLHDGLSQQLAGVALLSKVLHQRLEAKSLSEASDARRIVDLVNDAIAQTRNLARGLSPVQIEEQGLQVALEELALGVESFHSVSCRFRCSEKIFTEDHVTATHLYRIAQEAVSNALKHGEPSQIDIELDDSNEFCRLTVRDNGKGIAEIPAHSNGMGFHIMQYRARMIDATLDIRPAPKGGTMVICELTRDSVENKAEAR